ncbi:MAG TPA: methionine biosynthesis protein MetW [Acidimicrobiales bacterium]
MPPAQPSTPSVVPIEPTPSAAAVPDDPSERSRYLADVMAEIDAEVRRRRASGDLPVGLEQELDELFLEFSPIGLHGRARLRETLSLVDRSAYVDIAVPVESQKVVGSYVKRLIRKSMTWYIGFIVHQIVKFAWSVSRMLHVVVDHVEDLEAAVEVQRMPPLPASVVPDADPGAAWWAGEAITALSGVEGRVLHADCGSGSLVEALVAAGVDAYGVEPTEAAAEAGVGRGLDVRAESLLDHLDVVADAALNGMVVSGSVQWLHPNERDRLVGLVGTRLAVGGVVVLHSSTPESWLGSVSPVISDLAPGRPLHAETWSRLLEDRGLMVTGVTSGGTDRRIDPVAGAHPDAASVNATIDAVNRALLGPGEYLLVAVRER